MRASDFYDLVSGRRRGVAATIARAALSAAEGPYRVVVWWRNRRYDSRPGLVTRVDAPVVSVGNLTLGGTGKTPMVKWVARTLRERGVRVALVSRGYGAQADSGVGGNDEALELEHALPDVPHVQNPDRVAAARLAIDELAAQAIVLDDGFQHRRLGRDLDIVLLDATAPFGFGRVFPRGALREPTGSLRRADAVCLTRADMVDAAARAAVRDRVARIAPHAIWCEAVARPTGLLRWVESGPLDPPAEAESVDRLAGQRVGAFCGLGNPAAFLATLRALGAEVAWFREYPDHHAYSRRDVEGLAAEAAASGVARVVCTHKDLVKVMAPELGGVPLAAVVIEADVVVGVDALRELMASRVLVPDGGA